MDNLKNVVREPNIAELKSEKSIHEEIEKHMVARLGNAEIPEYYATIC